MKSHFFIIFSKKKLSSGFTLIEVMVSVAIFAIIVTVGIGSLFTLNQAYNNTRTQQAVMDQLNFTLEKIMREIRTGTSYYCDPGFNLPGAGTNDCSGGETSFAFVTTDNEPVLLYWDATSQSILEQRNNAPATTLTPEEITITDVRFRVIGSAPDDLIQPIVVVSIAGSSAIRQQVTDFAVQMSVTQRSPDFLPTVPTPLVGP